MSGPTSAPRRTPTLAVLWQVLRPLTTLLVLLHALLAWLLFAAAGTQLTDQAIPHPGQVAAAVLLIATWYAHAVAVNDLSDVEVDRINLVTDQQRSQRPLVNDSSSPARLWTLVAVLSLVQLLLAWPIAGWLVAVTAVMVLLNGVYSLPPFRWSARGALAQLSLPLGYVVYPATIGFALTGTTPASWPAVTVLAGLAVLFCGRLFLKDIRDETGDRSTGKRTFLVRHGLTPTLVTSGTVMTAGLLLSGAGLSMWLGRASPSLLINAVAMLAVTPWALGRLRRTPSLQRKLLWVGLIGRLATNWLFCCLLLVSGRASGLPWWQCEVLAGFGIVIFAFGCLRFAEELRTTD